MTGEWVLYLFGAEVSRYPEIMSLFYQGRYEECAMKCKALAAEQEKERTQQEKLKHHQEHILNYC